MLFLDAIASPCNWCCQWASQWVSEWGDNFRFAIYKRLLAISFYWPTHWQHQLQGDAIASKKCICLTSLSITLHIPKKKKNKWQTQNSFRIMDKCMHHTCMSMERVWEIRGPMDPVGLGVRVRGVWWAERGSKAVCSNCKKCTIYSYKAHCACQASP